MDNRWKKRGRKGLGAILGRLLQNEFWPLRNEAEQEASKGEENGSLLIVKLDKVSPNSAYLRFLSWPFQGGCGGRPGREALHLP